LTLLFLQPKTEEKRDTSRARWGRKIMQKSRVYITSFLAVVCAGCQPTPSTSLQAELHKNYNLDLLQPASQIYTPGTFAKVTVIDPGKDSGGRIVFLSRFCQPGSALPLADVTKSPTSDLTVTYNISGDVSAKAELQKIAQLGAGINAVDKVEVTLTNPVIYRPNDLQLKAARDAIRQMGCPLAGRSQVTAVLQADVTVKTTVSNSANVSVSEAKIIQNIVDASFGANISTSDNTAMTGKSLFYGIEVDSGV
jgi:hypothetical protein